MLGSLFRKKKSSESRGKSEVVYALSFVYNKIHGEEKLTQVHFLIWVLFLYSQHSWLRLVPSMLM